jgi:predicted nucleotidyltransferase
MTVHIQIPQRALQSICRRYHVQRLALFGLVLRKDFGPERDVDVLVEFEPGHTPGLGLVSCDYSASSPNCSGAQ